MSKSTKNNGWINLLKSALVLLLATLLALAFREWHIREENILMLYLIAVIIITLEVKTYVWSTVCAVLCVVIFNFLFTEPYYSFHVKDPNYVFTMLLFLIVALITGMLVSRLYLQIRIAERTSRQTQSLFEISNGYLTISGLENIMYYGIKSLYRIQGDRCVVYLAQDLTALSKPYFVEAHFPDISIMEDGTLAKWCFLNVTPCGAGTSFYSASKWKYLPIKGNASALGVMGIYCGEGDIDRDQMVFVDTILFQMATAIERELLYKNRLESPEELEKPFDARLLDALSQRLEPAAARLMDDAAAAGQNAGRTKEYAEALRLRLLAGNLHILNLSRQGGEALNKDMESVNEILEQAAALFAPLGEDRTVSLSLVTPLQKIPANRMLLLLAVCDLLENTWQHTRRGTEIHLETVEQPGRVLIRVTDNGGGIPTAQLPHLLDDPEEQPSLRLGLPVCQSIVAFHRGTLQVDNNEQGGVTASISLPEQAHRRE